MLWVLPLSFWRQPWRFPEALACRQLQKTQFTAFCWAGQHHILQLQNEGIQCRKIQGRGIYRSSAPPNLVAAQMAARQLGPSPAQQIHRRHAHLRRLPGNIVRPTCTTGSMGEKRWEPHASVVPEPAAVSARGEQWAHRGLHTLTAAREFHRNHLLQRVPTLRRDALPPFAAPPLIRLHQSRR
eukprot:COSAG01_NODE_5527_length_4205_cov_2.387725_5_plen_183_part_00